MDDNYCHPFKQLKLSVQNNIIVSRTTSLITGGNLKVVFTRMSSGGACWSLVI